MTHAIVVKQTGGPEVMTWGEVELAAPGPGEVRLRHTAIGVNFLDIYFRKGVYQPPGGLPLTPGAEGAGIVEAVGEGVTAVKPGDRVVYQGAVGGYSEERLIMAERLVKIPDAIDDRVAAAAFLKGTTVQTLLRRTFKVEKGHAVLWHAAAGAVGTIATQWAKALGATVIGTVGSDDKIALARANGCDHVINYRTADFVKEVRAVTGGAGVEVVYDSIGKDTFPGSLDCLKPMGMWVSFGQSSGLPPPVPMSLLQQKGSLFATRPTVTTYVAKRADLEASAAELFKALTSGMVKVPINLERPLAKASEVHQAIEDRKTVGATVLIP